MMTAYTATAAPPGAALTSVADRTDGAPTACLRIRARLMQHARRLAADPGLGPRLERKRAQRADDEQARPLAAYLAHELDRCHSCFFGPDRRYHDARHRFVHQLGAPCATDAGTQLHTAVKDYERHVLAWYALGRSADARAARDEIERLRRLAAGEGMDSDLSAVARNDEAAEPRGLDPAP